MKPQPNLPPSELRRRAQERLAQRNQELAGRGAEAPADTLRLVHELRVHQVELELQNEELQEARSELEAALALYEDLYDSAPVGYLSLTADGTIQRANRACGLLVQETHGALLNRRLAEFIADEDLKAFNAYLEDLMGGQCPHACDVHIRRQDAALSILQLDAAPEPAGGCRMVMTDITQRRAAEAHLLRAQRLETIGTLAGGVAHDLNNILAPILLSAHLLRGVSAGENSRDLIEMIEKSANRGAEVTRNLLTYARGQPDVRRLIAVGSVIEETRRLLMATLPSNIHFTVKLGDDLLPVNADATQMQQAIVNLCVNARDAMPEGGELSIRVENATVPTTPGQTGTTRRCVRIAVSDTGAGIAREHLDRIFDPFFTTKAIGKGTGLGLAVVLGIMRAHDGSVQVHTKQGVGATFELCFPAEEPCSPPPAPLASGELPRGNSERILVVDDEPTVLESLSLTLEHLGYRVFTARNGPDALSLQAQRPGELEAVLTDMMMPGMSGLQLVVALREKTPSLPALVVTGYPEWDAPGDRAALRRKVSVLLKPFDCRTLAEALHRLLAKASASA